MKRGSWENLGEKWVQCLRKSLNPGHTLAPPLIFIISNKTITYDCWLQQFFRQFCLFVNFGHVHWPPPVDSLCVDCYYSRWLKTVLILELIQRSEEKRLWFDSFLTLTVFDSVLLFLSLLLWWWPTVVSLPQEEKKKQMFIFRRRQESEKYKFFKLSTEKKKTKAETFEVILIYGGCDMKHSGRRSLCADTCFLSSVVFHTLQPDIMSFHL